MRNDKHKNKSQATKVDDVWGCMNLESGKGSQTNTHESHSASL